MRRETQVAVIGAGPAGAVCAAMLAERGVDVLLIESTRFPRFSIGESLLPQVTECLQAAGLLDAVADAGFQYKDGALFTCGTQCEVFRFADKTAPGPHHAWEVKRAEFDHLLARQAEAKGVEIAWETRVLDCRESDRGLLLDIEDADGPGTVHCRFVVDASGFGRVMARLAKLESPSELAPRRAIFHHVRPRDLAHGVDGFDRNKITIAQASLDAPYWCWLIPFADGSASLGVVGDIGIGGSDAIDTVLDAHVGGVAALRRWLDGAEVVSETRSLAGYSCNVRQLFGKGYVLLGNAGEFVDPIFSSGVSIACRSAVMAAPLVLRELRGEAVDWHGEFEQPLRRGVNVFRVFVEAWYEGSFPRLIYAVDKDERYRRYISSVLAGYTWDEENPFTRISLKGLRELSRMAAGHP